MISNQNQTAENKDEFEQVFNFEPPNLTSLE